MTYKIKFEKIKCDTESTFDLELSFNLLKELVMDIRHGKETSQDIDMIKEIFTYWATLIGCIDDGEVVESIIDELYDNGFISNIEQEYFWSNVYYRQG